MDLTTSLILGVVQGATEFLPVSSSGHLVLAERVLGSRASAGLVFEVSVHFATMLAVLIYFRTRIAGLVGSILPPYTLDKRDKLRLLLILGISTIPAGVIGLAFEKLVEDAFRSTTAVSLFLLVTAAMLLLTGLVKHGTLSVNLPRGLVIGMAQAAALLPGISRSGSTISAGLVLKIRPEEAAEFSFLLSLPAVFGATILKSFDLVSASQNAPAGVYVAGSLMAFVVGYLSIGWLIRVVKKGRFFYFGVYCAVVGLSSLIFL